MRSDPAAGTIAARIESDGRSLVVDSLDVTDLAGASATLSGTIAADGTGRIAGRLRAPAAAPLIGLLERVWSDDIRAVPDFLRTAPLDLAVVIDRPAQDDGGLRVQAKGNAGGGTLDLSVRSRDGRLAAGSGTLTTAKAGSWFGRSDIPGLQQPADLRVTAEPRREGLSLTLAGTVAGLSLTPARRSCSRHEASRPRAGR